MVVVIVVTKELLGPVRPSMKKNSKSNPDRVYIQSPNWVHGLCFWFRVQGVRSTRPGKEYSHTRRFCVRAACHNCASSERHVVDTALPFSNPKP